LIDIYWVARTEQRAILLVHETTKNNKNKNNKNKIIMKKIIVVNESVHLIRLKLLQVLTELSLEFFFPIQIYLTFHRSKRKDLGV
ncbi:MAG: hypothetical protein M1365_05270, partial [Actinobacteria bacterium]|nr:hypothetical protein [Actinomycetota bacterium]